MAIWLVINVHDNNDLDDDWSVNCCQIIEPAASTAWEWELVKYRLTISQQRAWSTTAHCLCLEPNSFRFYRVMHFSAKRGIAIACRLSVCL